MRGDPGKALNMKELRTCHSQIGHFEIMIIWSEREIESESRSVMSDSLRPHGLYSPWNSPGQNTGVGSLSLLQGCLKKQRMTGKLSDHFFYLKTGHTISQEKGDLPVAAAEDRPCLQRLESHAEMGLKKQV